MFQTPSNLSPTQSYIIIHHGLSFGQTSNVKRQASSVKHLNAEAQKRRHTTVQRHRPTVATFSPNQLIPSRQRVPSEDDSPIDQLPHDCHATVPVTATPAMNNAGNNDINVNTCTRTSTHSLPASPSSPHPSHHVVPATLPPVSPKQGRKKDKTPPAKSEHISKHSRKPPHLHHTSNKPPSSHPLVPNSRTSPAPDRQRSFPRSQVGRVSKSSESSSRNTRSAMVAAHAAVAAAHASSPAITTTKTPSSSWTNINNNYTSASNIPSPKVLKAKSAEPTKNSDAIQLATDACTSTTTTDKLSAAKAPPSIPCSASSYDIVPTPTATALTVLPPTKPECSSCDKKAIENELLQRRVARLIYRVQTAAEMQRTHGQRILRAYYEQKVLAMDGEHRRTVAAMLNRQKLCFEVEMENLESESRSREAALNTQLQEERGKLASMASVMSAIQREKESVVERSEEAMRALQRNLTQLQARTARLEHEKTSLEVQLAEKRVLVDTLAAAASVPDHEVRREDIVAQLSKDERIRKDKIIDALHAEIKGLRHRLNAEMEINAQLVHSIKTVEEKRRDDRVKHEESLGQCKAGFQKDADRLGRLIASVIQEFANAPSEASTRSGSNESTEGGGREDSVHAGSIGTDGE